MPSMLLNTYQDTRLIFFESCDWIIKLRVVFQNRSDVFNFAHGNRCNLKQNVKISILDFFCIYSNEDWFSIYGMWKWQVFKLNMKIWTQYSKILTLFAQNLNPILQHLDPILQKSGPNSPKSGPYSPNIWTQFSKIWTLFSKYLDPILQNLDPILQKPGINSPKLPKPWPGSILKNLQNCVTWSNSPKLSKTVICPLIHLNHGRPRVHHRSVQNILTLWKLDNL